MESLCLELYNFPGCMAQLEQINNTNNYVKKVIFSTIIGRMYLTYRKLQNSTKPSRIKIVGQYGNVTSKQYKDIVT